MGRKYVSWNAPYASGPSSAAVKSATLPGPMPAIQSRPSASNGARPASVAAARHLSGSMAAHAKARGPPPDQPTTMNSSIRNSSTMVDDVRNIVDDAWPLIQTRSGRGAAVPGP